MSRSVISVENLSKAYRIGLKEEIPDTLTSAVLGFAKAPFKRLRELRRLNTFSQVNDAEDTIWALKDVSFEVQEGEVLGVIGRNGAGKSTLLKILSRITEPTSGRAIIRGRVSSLLEVGTGFHPELSGRENVYLNGTILGMTKREIDRKFDEIVDFSGVEKFLDTPIKRYSSGMKVRLAFAVAAHLDPEILIIDEVLAVGDAEFQKKCLGKMQDVARGGRTVLFVSHDMVSVARLCSQVLIVSQGRCHGIQPPKVAIREYARSSDFEAHEGTLISGAKTSLRAGRLISRVWCYVNGRRHSPIMQMGDAISISVEFCGSPRPFVPVLGVVVRSGLGQALFGVNNRFINEPAVHQAVSHGIIRCDLGQIPLVPGAYTIDVFLGDPYEDLDVIESALPLEVEPSDYYGTGRICPPAAGPIRWTASWQLTTTLNDSN